MSIYDNSVDAIALNEKTLIVRAFMWLFLMNHTHDGNTDASPRKAVIEPAPHYRCPIE